MAKKEESRFVQPIETIKKVEQPGSWRDLTPKQQRDRMRAMYRDVQPEQQAR